MLSKYNRLKGMKNNNPDQVVTKSFQDYHTTETSSAFKDLENSTVGKTVLQLTSSHWGK